MSDSELFPFEYDDRIINCQSAESRQLLSDATMIFNDNSQAAGFTEEQMRKMSDACGFYELPHVQRALMGLIGPGNA